jgi:subtilase family serine protease
MIGVASAASSITWAQATPAETQVRAAVPYPTRATPQAVDRGALVTRSATTPISVTVALKFSKMDEAESLLKAIHTPGDPQFHHFLTAAEFNSRFAPSDADVAKVMSSFTRYGLSAQRTGIATIGLTGRPADVERAFSVSLHSYEVPSQGKVAGYSFHAPLSSPAVPAEVSASVAGVFGLDDRPSLHPNNRAASTVVRQARPKTASGNPPGLLTVTDFANYYDVTPLYQSGLTGAKRTMGIMTFASFRKSDAYAYWNAIGLTVDPNRIHNIDVDGGPGAPSDASGSVETTLDVEQSGGIAPGAKIWVYQAPNTDQGFVDLFAAATEANQTESLSLSWGAWEWYYNSVNSPVTDPNNGHTVALKTAIHQFLLRAAIQGQSVFAASGDSGAYDVNDNGCPLPHCSLTLSVDYPASDPAITAAGGTTLPGLQQYCLDEACDAIYNVHIPHERVWSWDYLDGLCAALGYDPLSCGIFPAGSGGGVSIASQLPVYQFYLPGIQLSQPNQYLTYNGRLVDALPAFYAGRNVPDISFNADPDTGYLIFYTSSVDGPEVLEYYGGTSFVAPQLNGVSALLIEDLKGKRLGLLNYPLYSMAFNGQAYAGPNPPMHAIKYGNNEFYLGTNGYNPGVGLGTLDVANFAAALSKQ